jgi:vesicular inhibitory amino acid transporter
MDGKASLVSSNIGPLDFKQAKDDLKKQATLVSLADTQKNQERKAKEAAEYRARILKQQKERKPYPVEMSPAFGREKASLVRSKKHKADKGGRKKNLDGKATTAQCIFNLANILMGVGLLTLPYACKTAGALGGGLAIVSLAFVTWRTSIMIGRELNGDPRPLSYFDDSPWKSPLQPGSTPEARMRIPLSGFPDIARAAFGDVGSVLLACVLYFELFSCIGIFMVSIGDHMHTLFPSNPATTYMVGTAIFSAVPIILLRTARLLSYLSMVGTVATVCVVVAVVLCYVFEGDITERIAETMPNVEPPYHELWNTNGIPLAFGLVAYCFSGHAIVPSIFCSMERPQDFEKVVNISFGIVLVACLAVGLSGYLMFGSFVLDQVTLSLEQNSSAALAMTILTYLMILTAISKLTLTMFPLAIGMEEIFAPYLSTEKGMEVVSILIRVVLLCGALLVALFVPSFSFLCSMVGMICTMIVSVIFPAAAYLRLFGPKLGSLEKLMYGVFVVAGSIIAVVGTVLSVG